MTHGAWRKLRAPVFVVLALTAVLESSATAVEVGAEGSAASVDIHAFVSQAYLFTTNHNNYLAPDASHGSFQFSEAGINFTKTVVDKLRIGVQFYASDIGTPGDYSARLDWAYIDYRWKDWLAFRAGRVKIPFGLYNEFNDIDSGRVPVLLPQSVYPLQNRNFLLAQTGAELYGYLRTKHAGALEYRAYAGTIFVDTAVPAGSPFQVASLNVPYVIGGRIMWETPLEGLRLGGSVQTLRLDLTALQGPARAEVEIPAVLWVGSVEYTNDRLAFAAEYSRWHVKSDSSDATIFPASPAIASERAYVMGSYRVATWFQPGAYYSVYFPNVDQRDGRAARQLDLAGTLRFDINAYWLFKLEGHFMAGTAGLTPSLNENTPTSALDRYWGAFLAKTTGYF